MKQIIAGIALLAVITVFCAVNSSVCGNIAIKTQSLLFEARRIPERTERIRKLQAAREEWEQHSAWLNIVTSHEAVEAVSIALARLSSSEMSGDDSGTDSNHEELVILLDHISHSSRLSIVELF